MNGHRLVVVIVAALALCTSVRAQPCGPQWSGEFTGDGTDNHVRALVLFDDGAGEAVYAAGYFGAAGAARAPHIAKFDGTEWHALGDGVDGDVYAMAVLVDGTGPSLYAAGNFLNAGGSPARRIARWDGAHWHPVGSGVDNLVRALAAFDDGHGPAMYAAGFFTEAGGVPAQGIAKWDGQAWSPVSGGLTGLGYSLAAHDDGTGPALFVGGNFTGAGGVSASRIARWDGAAWSAVGAGMNSTVVTLLSDPAATPPALYAGGLFSVAGVAPALGVAKLQGGEWTGVGDGVNSFVSALALLETSQGDELVAAGNFTSAGSGRPARYVARLENGRWNPVAGGVGSVARALLAYHDDSGPVLFVGGEFEMAGSLPAAHIAAARGNAWGTVGDDRGISGDVQFMTSVDALERFDDGAGPAVFAGGLFSRAGGAAVHNLARWDGDQWSDVGGGVTGDPGMTARVNAVRAFGDSHGPAVYVGGFFAAAGGVRTAGIARWDGVHWSALGDGLGPTIGGGAPTVYALQVFDDGRGPGLFVGGLFTSAGGIASSNVARWDGSQWTAAGAGLTGQVNSLAVFDDGHGPALYAGGNLIPPLNRWNGTQWEAVGPGFLDPYSRLVAMTVADVGDGPALYVGGTVVRNPNSQSLGVARWDGVSWRTLVPVGEPCPDVGCIYARALAPLDDGTSRALYVGGSFRYGQTGRTGMLARWDGSTWSRVAGGLDAPVNALLTLEGPVAPSLLVGGEFQLAGDSHAQRVARLVACPPACPADWDRSGSVDSFDFFSFLIDFFAGLGDFNHDGLINSQDFFDFLTAFFRGCP